MMDTGLRTAAAPNVPIDCTSLVPIQHEPLGSTEAIWQRTRARNSLTGTSIEELEALLHDDFSEPTYNDDEAYMAFLSVSLLFPALRQFSHCFRLKILFPACNALMVQVACELFMAEAKNCRTTRRQSPVFSCFVLDNIERELVCETFCFF